jgi:hypothetical protein
MFPEMESHIKHSIDWQRVVTKEEMNATNNQGFCLSRVRTLDAETRFVNLLPFHLQVCQLDGLLVGVLPVCVTRIRE